MKAFVYIIHSAKWDRYYIGYTTNISVRLEYHDSGRNKSTRGGGPWKLMFTEEFNSEKEARRREYQIKRKKSRRYLEYLIERQI